MRYFVAFLFCVFVLNTASGQQYRLVYEKDDLPELYNHVIVYVQEQKGSSYVKLPTNKYKLSTNEADYRNGVLTIDRNKLQKNKGVVNFTLLIKSKTIPLQLQLPVLKSIRYNLYTDSIKPILNYYVNVEGEFSSGRILPLDSNLVTINADHGMMKGMEWVVPVEHNFEQITFTATVKGAPQLSIVKTVYLKKYKDPRDAPDYRDATEEEVKHGRQRR